MAAFSDLACLELKDGKGAYLTLLQVFLAFPLSLDMMIYTTEMGNRGAQLVHGAWYMVNGTW